MARLHAALASQPNTRRWPGVGLMLGNRLRRWPNIIPSPFERLLFAGGASRPHPGVSA